jgi:hypothetical protein
MSQSKQFWKYVDFFRKINSTSVQLEVDDKYLVEPWKVATEFVKHSISLLV